MSDDKTPPIEPHAVNTSESSETVQPQTPSNNLEVSEFAEKKKLGIGFWLATFWLVMITFLAVFAPVLPFKDDKENFIVFEQKENPITGKLQDRPVQPPYSPNSDHWLGTDQDARDLLSRSINGARISLAVGALTALFGVIVGGALGMIAGYFKGILDKIISAIFIVSLSFPGLILAILIVALMDRSLTTISVTLGILGVAPIGRLARAQTLSFSEREFVLAAETLGAKKSRILVKELLPNVLIPMSTLAMLVIAIAIVAEGTLAFLGLSVQGSATWGKLILTGSGLQVLEKAPWVAFVPMGFLFLTVASFNYMSDRLRDYFDVREIFVTRD
ncbi:MAG TPA: ABC transporter permease [Acidimicrobiales bacterium]|nr:ABC transporter permease [Acidimicrobiales bacterium]|tara:strand:- start:3030 stop:4025 length:996 start_codon:yes stop_codon:yes gene_type:complete